MNHRTPAATLVFALTCVLSLAPLARAAEDRKGIPPDADNALDRIQTSPRHGEWAKIDVPGLDRPMRAFVVYPEVKEKAPVVIVIFEIFGMTDWVRGVGDQLAADGFIAVVPDLLLGKGAGGGDSASFAKVEDVRAAVSGLTPGETKARLDAAHAFGKALPASSGKTATIGFCWGGKTSFLYATQQPDLAAAVVYYGASPESGYENIKAPVLGLYGENDERVNSTIPRAEAKMKELGKPYTAKKFEKAGHGFLRQQSGPKDAPGANGKASEAAWKETVAFLKENTK
jgi:carboxymethylenebutenolidase